MKRLMIFILIVIVSVLSCDAKNNKKDARFYQKLYESALNYIMNDMESCSVIIPSHSKDRLYLPNVVISTTDEEPLFKIGPDDIPFNFYPDFLNRQRYIIWWYPFDLQDIYFDKVSEEPQNENNERGFKLFLESKEYNDKSEYIVFFTRCKDYDFFAGVISARRKGWLKTNEPLENLHLFNKERIYHFIYNDRGSFEIVKQDMLWY